MSDYEDGYLAAQNERASLHHGSKAVGSLVGLSVMGLVRLAGLVLPLGLELVAAAPLLVLGFALTLPLHFLGPDFSTARLLLTGGLAYFFLVALYYLKGMAIASRLRGGRRWLLPIGLCIGAACLVPALLLHLFIVRFVPNPGLLFSWALPVAFTLLVCTRYRFTADYAPSLVLWAYRWGYQGVSK